MSPLLRPVLTFLTKGGRVCQDLVEGLTGRSTRAARSHTDRVFSTTPVLSLQKLRRLSRKAIFYALHLGLVQEPVILGHIAQSES